MDQIVYRPKIKSWFFSAALMVFLAFGGSAQAGFRLVSDLDDTIKITNVKNPKAAVVNFLTNNAAFAGMSTLYNEWLSEQKNLDGRASGLVVVTAGIKAFEKIRTLKYLQVNGLGHAQLVSRSNDLHVQKYDHKVQTILRLMQETDEKLVLIGDDAEMDPEAYTEVLRQKPERIAAIYIRRVTGRELPEGITAFSHSLDIALLEHAAGRLSRDRVLSVAQAVLSSEHSLVRPAFLAPEKAQVRVDLTSDPELEEWLRRVDQKFETALVHAIRLKNRLGLGLAWTGPEKSRFYWATFRGIKRS